jgi:NAD(P)-dependent dehydrogenase (short-subunit alcohol dehydrogenase family)|tara:strand:- start:1838 stop:2092 length:255 start_codon:yes stop_codon:yes gene_type:complete
MPGKLKNKVAIVTGGNSGIGESTVHLFAEEGRRFWKKVHDDSHGQVAVLKYQTVHTAGGGNGDLPTCRWCAEAHQKNNEEVKCE